MSKKMQFKTSFKTHYRSSLMAIIGAATLSSAALTGCATTPEIREIDGPIILDAPDSVVRAEPDSSPAQINTQINSQTNSQTDFDPYPFEEVQTVPVTPITCPPGSSPQADGSCLLSN